MSYNGSGVFSLVSGNPVITGTTISSTWANNTLSDIANNGLTNCLTKDGQQTPTNNIPMGGFRITGLGAGTARTDAAQVGQVQDGAVVFLSSVAGTDTITGVTSPVTTSYTAGQTFRFVAAGANTTTTVTLNINSLGAKSITKNGSSALAIGDIQSGALVVVTYDGTRFQLSSLPRGMFLGRQVFSASGTYTPTPGATMALIRMIGAGGAGGGSPAAGAGAVGLGLGGAGGAYAELLITTGLASQTVTIGAAGVGVSGGTGGTGGTTSFGTLITCTGGSGGFAQGPSASFVLGSQTNTAAVGGSATPSIAVPGPFPTDKVVALSSAAAFSGMGAVTIWGKGGGGQGGTAGGGAAQGFGAGGGGGATAPSSAAQIGGAGAPGYMMIDEFA